MFAARTEESPRLRSRLRFQLRHQLRLRASEKSDAIRTTLPPENGAKQTITPPEEGPFWATFSANWLLGELAEAGSQKTTPRLLTPLHRKITPLQATTQTQLSGSCIKPTGVYCFLRFAASTPAPRGELCREALPLGEKQNNEDHVFSDLVRDWLPLYHGRQGTSRYRYQWPAGYQWHEFERRKCGSFKLRKDQSGG